MGSRVTWYAVGNPGCGVCMQVYLAAVSLCLALHRAGTVRMYLAAASLCFALHRAGTVKVYLTAASLCLALHRGGHS